MIYTFIGVYGNPSLDLVARMLHSLLVCYLNFYLCLLIRCRLLNLKEMDHKERKGLSQEKYWKP